MKKTKILLLLAGIFGLLLLVACATIIPIPTDATKIIAPSPDLPLEIAAFSGRWEGTWENGLKAILIVNEIDSKKAKVTYAWGDLFNSMYRIEKGYRRHIAKVVPGPKPKLEIGTRRFIFEMRDDLKTMDTSWETGSDWGRGKMRKIE